MRGVQTVAGLGVALMVLGFGAVLWARPTPVGEGDACEGATSAPARAFLKATVADPEALRAATLYVLHQEAGPQGASALNMQAKLELRTAFHKEASALAFCRRATASGPSGRVVSLPAIAAVLAPYAASEAEAWSLARCAVMEGRGLPGEPAAAVARLRAACRRG